MEFGKIPAGASLKPAAFQAKVDDSELDDFKQLLKLSKIGPETFENLHEDNTYGLSHKWITQAKQYWETGYNWRSCEAKINSYPNFTVPIDDGYGRDLNIHFAALFSEKSDAVPLILIHGWPGSFMELFGILDLLKKRYAPTDLPYHVIVPSIPGYGYSSGPPLDHDFGTKDQARIMNDLMVGLGFGAGYIAQGGDIGSFISRALAVEHSACKAAHFNMIVGVTKETRDKFPPSTLNDKMKKGVQRGAEWGTTGTAYGMEHATRPATIGLVLSASPVALLAWIAEKFQQWTDTDPSLDVILDDVTLYWFTKSFPRSIYNYREFNLFQKYLHGNADMFIRKPMGYSYFPYELTPCPKSWAETTGNLVFWREYDQGGHFAALEKPEVLLKDIEDFTAQVWASASKL